MLSKVLDMLQRKTTLETDKDGKPALEEAKIATAALLFSIAGSDSDFAPEEVKACYVGLAVQFGLDDKETMEVMTKAEQAFKEQAKIDSFVELINKSYNEKQRQLIFAMAWRVVVADQRIENHEQKFASELRVRLQLTRDQAEEAKKLVFEGAV